MCLAPAAFHFGSFHTKAVIFQVDHTVFCNGLIKAGPATGADELSFTSELRIPSGCTVICSYSPEFFKFTRPWSFRPFHAGNIIHVPGQNFFPFFIAQINAGSICMRIYIAFLCCGRYLPRRLMLFFRRLRKAALREYQRRYQYDSCFNTYIHYASFSLLIKLQKNLYA